PSADSHQERGSSDRQRWRRSRGCRRGRRSCRPAPPLVFQLASIARRVSPSIVAGGEGSTALPHDDLPPERYRTGPRNGSTLQRRTSGEWRTPEVNFEGDERADQERVDQDGLRVRLKIDRPERARTSITGPAMSARRPTITSTDNA